MNRLKYVLAGAAALGVVALASGSASAMPNGLSSDALSSNANVEQVRWVCGPYRCWWRPNYYYGYYGVGTAVAALAPLVTWRSREGQMPSLFLSR